MHVCVCLLIDGTQCVVCNKELYCTDVSDSEDWSPLHLACVGGHKDVVEYLVEKADCDVSE